MKKFPLPALSLIALVMGLLLTTTACKAGFGLSPPWVMNDHLMPGDTYESIVYLSRNNPETEQHLTDLRKEGNEEVFKWITIPNISNFILPKGENLVPMNVTVKVPENAMPGQYKGDIYFLVNDVKKTQNVGANAVSIGFGGHLIIDLTVLGSLPAIPETDAGKPALPSNSQDTTPKVPVETMTKPEVPETPAEPNEEKPPVTQTTPEKTLAEAIPEPGLKPAATVPDNSAPTVTTKTASMSPAVPLIAGGVLLSAAGSLWILKKRGFLK